MRRGVFRALFVGLLFGRFSLGPPYAKSQKMADFIAFAKFAITLLCVRFWSRRLRQNVVRCLHFKRILIKGEEDLRRGVFRALFVGLLFGRFFLGPPYAKSQKMADFSAFAKFAITLLCVRFWSRRLRQNVVRCLHFKRILIKGEWDLRRGVFRALFFGLLFGRFSLGPPCAKSQKMADFIAFAKFAITLLCVRFWSRRLRQNVVRCFHFKRILIKGEWDLRRRAFRALFVGLLFGRFSLGPPYAKSQKMADFSAFAKFAITLLCVRFWSRRLRQNVVRCLHFKRILIKGEWDLRRRAFRALFFGLLFGRFSLGPPYAKSQKMADFIAFAKFAITLLCVRFWSRRLRQNVVRCLHFKRILIKGEWDLRRLAFRALFVGLLFGRFSLGPPYAKSQKMADFSAFAKFAITLLCVRFWSRRLRQNVVRCLHFNRILIKGEWDLRRRAFRALFFGLLFRRFSLGPPYAKSQKMADFIAFAKFAITLLCVRFWSRRLRQNVVRCLHFKRILIKGEWDLRRLAFRALFVGLLFGRFSLGPPYAKSQKMADFIAFAKFAITLLCLRFWSRRLRQNVVRCLHFKSILMKGEEDLRRGVFRALFVGLLSGRFSLGPPYAKSQKMADFSAFAKFAITLLCVRFWSRRLRQNVVRCLHFKRILIKGEWDLRRSVLWAVFVGLLFWRFSLGPPYAKSQKMADFSAFAKFAITLLCVRFWCRRLRQNVVRCLHFKRILIKGEWDLRRGVFRALFVALLFRRLSLGPPYAKSQKMADFIAFAKFAITLLCVRFWSRRLRQNVVRCLHFKRILNKGEWDLRLGVFRALFVGLLFGRFSLGPPYAKSQKMADFIAFANFAIALVCLRFRSRRLRQNVVRCLHFKCILIKGKWDCRRGVFRACFISILLRRFSLGPP